MLDWPSTLSFSGMHIQSCQFRPNLLALTLHADTALSCRSQVQVSQVVQTTSTDRRSGPNDIHVGDVLHVTLETSETPFGDPAVVLEAARDPDHFNVARNELRAALESGQSVMGRLLNPLIGGYAVGVGGIVGFCSFKNCSLPVASRIGVLQPFRVIAFRDQPFNLVLQDADVKPHNEVDWSADQGRPAQQFRPQSTAPQATRPQPKTLQA